MAMNRATEQPQPSMKPVVSRLGILLLIAFCLIFISSYTNRLVQKAQIDQEIQEWDQRIAEAEEQQLELLQELAYVQSDAYIESAARNDLDMARPGDTVLMVMDNANIPPQPVVTQPDTVEVTKQPENNTSPNWLQWITIFVGDD